ncbi:MAG: hypothetical protein KF723_04295 [Rhizobiaceae bacterium]|nr:hypothetical protein [Rhizobiaceae bacterium]
MTKPINTLAIEKGTGRSWRSWLKFLETIDARNLSHKEIADRVYKTGDASGWWAQSVATAFEQHIGRRAAGQDGDGTFQVSATAMVEGPMDAALARWLSLVAGAADFGGVAISRNPEVSRTEKWRWWRCGLADASRINLGISDRPGGKAGVGLSHEKLESAEAVEQWREYWKALLAQL